MGEDTLNVDTLKPTKGNKKKKWEREKLEALHISLNYSPTVKNPSAYNSREDGIYSLCVFVSFICGCPDLSFVIYFVSLLYMHIHTHLEYPFKNDTIA